jgi:hypothetical protein
MEWMKSFPKSDMMRATDCTAPEVVVNTRLPLTQTRLRRRHLNLPSQHSLNWTGGLPERSCP